MKKKELQEIAQAAAKNIKTEEDLNEFRAMLTKITVEAALNAELDDHLGFDKHELSESDNNRNGVTHKTLQTEDGQFELATPRDRAGSFEPRLVRKHQRRFTSMDDKILFLYAQGMTTREIVRTFKEMYGADASHALISNFTDAVIEEVVEWQSRPLDAVYPIVYLDCIVVKIRQDKRGSSTRPFIWRWASTWKATRSCWACGWPRTRVPSSGSTCSLSCRIGA